MDRHTHQPKSILAFIQRKVAKINTKKVFKNARKLEIARSRSLAFLKTFFVFTLYLKEDQRNTIHHFNY